MQIPSEMVPLLMKLIDTETVYLAKMIELGIATIVLATGFLGFFAWTIQRELKAIRMLIAGAMQAHSDEERRTAATVQMAKMND